MPAATRRNWNRDETLIAFRLYCRTPFGKLHKTNPEIVALAARLGRTPSAVGMKACNFASLDPKQHERGIRALANTSALEEQVWAEFEANPEAIAAEAEAAHERIAGAEPPDSVADAGDPPGTPPAGPTEVERVVRARRVQGFFRATVLTSYGQQCALTGLALPELLNASHIIPWSASVERRADPRNGICLNALLDRAFDRGLFTLDDGLCVVTSPRLDAVDTEVAVRLDLARLRGRRLAVPERFEPDPSALSYHRSSVFRA